MGGGNVDVLVNRLDQLINKDTNMYMDGQLVLNKLNQVNARRLT